MKKEERELVEWTNTWWSEANTDHKRGLLIGDSTTRQLRGSMEVFLADLYAVDLFASSFSIHDKRLKTYIDILFKDNEYKYDFIIVHYGGHHGYSRLCSGNPAEYIAYYKRYTKLLKYLMGKCENIVCVTTTSEVLDTDISTINQKTEREIISRNQIVSDVAQENRIEVFDLHELMKRDGKIYTYSDACHFNRDSDYFISYHLLKFMLSKNLIDEGMIKEQHLQGRRRLMEKVGNDKKFILYGTGEVGANLYWILKWYCIEDAICCFAVTSKNEDIFLKKPIRMISELDVGERENCILIICSEKYKDEMYRMASTLEIRNVIFYRDMLNSLLHKL